MKDKDLSAARKDVVQYMAQVASRNREGVEKYYPALLLALEKETDDEPQGLLLFVKGIYCFFNNNYNEAQPLFKQIFELPNKDANCWGAAHMGLGFTLRSLGMLDDAVTNLSCAADLIEPHRHFRTFLPYCYHQLGEIHATIQEYQQAISYFDKAYEIGRADSTPMSLFRHNMGLGGCYLKMKDYEKSRLHLTAALEVKNLPPTIIARCENDLGILYLETGEYDKAEEVLTRCVATREAAKLEDAACTSMTALAEVYLAQNKTAQALALLEHCSVLVEKFQTKWKKLEVLKLTARAHCQNKNTTLGVGYYEQYNTLYEQIRGEQERNIFKYKNEQIEKQRQMISDKHKQLASTFEEIKRLKVNRKAMIFSLATIIILVILSELVLDPFIENHTYNNLISLSAKVGIALLFKPLDGMYENILWGKTLKKVD